MLQALRIMSINERTNEEWKGEMFPVVVMYHEQGSTHCRIPARHSVAVSKVKGSSVKKQLSTKVDQGIPMDSFQPGDGP